MERLVRGLKAAGELKLVTVFIPISWIFVITAEIRRIFILLRSFHFLELKIEDFGSLLLHWII